MRTVTGTVARSYNRGCGTATRSRKEKSMDRKLAVLRPAIFVLVAAALAAVSGASGSTGAARPTAAAPKPATAKQWKAIVAKAKKEGSVVLYTTQNPVSVADMTAKF